MRKEWLTVLSLILLIACEIPFITDETEDKDLFNVVHDFDGSPITHKTSVTIVWTEITIENFKEYLIERATIDALGTQWDLVTRLRDSLAVSYIDTIDDDLTYQYRVRIVDENDQFRHTLSEPFTVPRVSRLQVPEDYLSIQEAFDSKFLDEGDTLLVNDGIYPGNFRFMDKSLVIRSVSGRDHTTLEGVSDTTSVVEINKGELIEFTVTGGISYDGGGLRARGTAHVRNCIITGNRTIRNEELRDDVEQIYPLGYGGGIYLTDSAILEDCIVSKNWALRGGGGILMDASATIVGTLVRKNLSIGSAGINVYSGNPLIRNSRISANSSFARYAEGGQGAGVFVENANIRLLNTILDRNYAGRGAGGLFIGSGSQVEVENCIFYKNESGLQNKVNAAMVNFGSVVVLNTIVWGNSRKAEPGLWDTASYSIIDEASKTSGPGIIRANPRFVDPLRNNFHLRSDSPCIDSGHPDAIYNDRDGTRNDMGVFGGPYGGD